MEKYSEDKQSEAAVTVLLVPFPAQGHLNQLLHFGLHLSNHGLSVHFAGSTIHNRQARDRLHGWPSQALTSITFHDIPLPPFSSPPPDVNSDMKFPSHLQPLFTTSMQLQPQIAPVLRLLSSSSRRLVVVHDPLMAFAAHEAASLPNAESFRFDCVPAFYVLSFIYELTNNLPSLASKASIPNHLVTPLDGCIADEFMSFVFSNPHVATKSPVEVGSIINSNRAIEGMFLDMLRKEPLFGCETIFTVGPVNPIPFTSGGDRHECLEWLDKQPEGSVAYVAFGSMTSLSDEQVRQLALGLERSGQRFIWVFRDADKGDIYADGEMVERGPRLTVEYEKKVAGFGMVVRGWAPQVEILAHRSTGVFVSHCGWNSCMEGMSAGVPFLAWPMHSDQPRNALMVTEYLKVGFMVRDWDRRKEVVEAEVVAELVRRVLVCEDGKEVRKRAKGLGEAIREGVGEGGSSHADLMSFIAYITR
ncbi:hypothetical protein J5N97_024091 [Dioscorea zingiberensis]|uniref:Glycosyltransferase N-terminal domain-containing protein n=1 Tax=Dioscorea zingiberensis TaxID=325984 RepID=A0A9D5H8F7_9LILI|nr:hypothetical protein J5N97_024091 [Dioscorea zingiberensis]